MDRRDDSAAITRRSFGFALAAASTIGGRVRGAPAVVVPDHARPAIPQGLASGDVDGGSAVVWARTDRPARMLLEWSTTGSFRDSRQVSGPTTLPEDDYTALAVLNGLPPGQTITYRVRFRDLASPKVVGPPAVGSFRTPPADRRDVRFAWSGDTAGQGWGIDPSRGGMRSYESVRLLRPDFFIHSGDYVYADNPIEAEVPLEDGTLWRNLTTEQTSKVAETLDEFRGRYRYNLLDEHVRRFNAEIPQFVQWDDHETRNNWYPGQILDDDRYVVRSVDLLAARARRAFGEYVPMRPHPSEAGRIYRAIRYGPLLDVFLLDARTYRGPNSANLQQAPGSDADFLGDRQIRWLERRLADSPATWKVIACDMPLSLVIRDGPDAFEAVANAEGGPPLGRELEIAGLLRRIKALNIRNVVWLTADVHYAAAHRYDPGRASFADFLPFWEFVAGPMHAGTFGPNETDPTFGPVVEFCNVPPGTRENRPPSEGLQSFGSVRIDGQSGVLSVTLHDGEGKPLYSTDLLPEI